LRWRFFATLEGLRAIMDAGGDSDERGAQGPSKKQKPSASKCVFHKLARSNCNHVSCIAWATLGEWTSEQRMAYEPLYKGLGKGALRKVLYHAESGRPVLKDAFAAHLEVLQRSVAAPSAGPGGTPLEVLSLTARVEGPHPVVLPNAGGGTPRLSTWDGFHEAYRDVRRLAICYRRVAGGDGWTLDPNGSEDWSVHQFYSWYQSAQRAPTMPPVAYYLTNIPLKDVDLRAWRAASAEIDALCTGGALDLMRYIRLWNEDAPVPPVKGLTLGPTPWTAAWTTGTLCCRLAWQHKALHLLRFFF
jgi:hypothetical protein